MYRVPTATYRVQFNSGFTFRQAEAIASYLAQLGISDLYASPILKARKGSGHGYDVVDADTLNPELGTEEDFDALHATLQANRLGLLLDIVPNHMAASTENAWWMSVLENGPNSRFLHYFDIDWRPVTAHGKVENKVLLPILGKPYGEILEAGEIRLNFDSDGFYFTYWETRLPLTASSYGEVLRHCVDALPVEGVGLEVRDLVSSTEPVTNSRFLKDTLWRLYESSEEFRSALDAAIAKINGEPGNVESYNTLDSLLDSQWYRLAYWRVASETINYRRFFDVTDLVGVRIENPEVFEARNRHHFAAIAQGKITGLRIDHIDGLYDPLSYMRKLQLRLANVPEGAESPHQPGEGQNFYVVVEKILANDEELPKSFPVAGTTGYDFADKLNALFVDGDGLTKLDSFYRFFTGFTGSFEDLVYARKKQVIQELFQGEMRVLAVMHLAPLASADRSARDFAPSDLLAALVELTACMHVYRTYTRDETPSATDREFIARAIEEARRRAPSNVDRRLFDFLESVLLIEPPPYVAEADRPKWLDFVMRWQQFTGRVMAKGVEDTAFYNYNRLLSLNEVGGEPAIGGDHDAIAAFHGRNEMMARDWPHTMNATSTHDTKRSEDVRARISVLSEIADEWTRDVRRWSKLYARLHAPGIPDPNVELLVYQTIVGMWPLEESQVGGVPARLRQYLEKAAREAKTHTSWIGPDEEYEKQLLAFADALVTDERFLEELRRVHRRTSFHGFLNSLSQTVLKIMAPGVPDFYQGTELWDFSLVDPDNRRPVDYETRRTMLRSLREDAERGRLDVATLLKKWTDGRVKLFTIWKALDTRRRHLDAMLSNAYGSVVATGERAKNAVAFTRGEELLVVVPRLTTHFGRALPLGDLWSDTTIAVEAESWRNVFTSEVATAHGGQLRLSDAFAKFPVAILERA